MKKMLAMALSLSMVLALASCAPAPAPVVTPVTPATNTEPAAETPAAKLPVDGTEIAMITDKGDINDKSFNQGTWEGVQQFSAESGKGCKYYKPLDATTDDYIASIEMAIEAGAKVVVTPGFLFETPIFMVQDTYPEVTFILIDGNPNNGNWDAMEAKTSKNTVGIKYAEEQVGYLAGYAAVKDGNTKLGFLGGQAVPAVVRYGFGYVQGANAAAKEMGVKVDMNYYYTGGFAATPEAQAMAAGWYTQGTEIIFACGGSVGNSAMTAAEASNGKVIGVDVDQSAESATVITSAMKGLRESVNQMLTSYYDGTFPGGENLTLGAKEKALGLPMENSKFTTFSQADYDKLFAQLADGTIVLQKDVKADGKTVATEPADVTGMTEVTVNFIPL